MGLWSSVTALKSTDGGQHWQHALPPPQHIVAAAPYRYEPTGSKSVLFGFRSPSNIIQSQKKDGFYYAFVTAGWGRHTANPAGQEPGACLMRTRDLTSPSSWRAWGGTSFNVSLAVNPYLSGPALEPARHVCQPLTQMSYPSLLWSSFFNRYLLFGTTNGNDHIGWSFQLLEDLGHPKLSEQTAIATGGHIEVGGNASRGTVPSPVPGTWARSINGSVVGAQVWWLSPENASKHQVHSCEPCGIPACRDLLRNVPIRQLDAIAQGRPFGCDMVGGAGGAGVSAYLYPSLIDESAQGANFETVGETASLFLVTSECVEWTNRSGTMQCNPFDSDGRLHRSVVKVPVRFSKS